ncbi:MAG: serine--tRNA ligase [Rhodospirillales bacterium]|nr:serine--tRNA ligase [Alphaproteobacteria bacterium]USO03561.1 MAG: serine--tRNA ligase [Rhodospirillales bacterium]
MFDIRAIRENPGHFDKEMSRRGLEAQSAVILKLDEEHRAVQTELQTIQAQRNDKSKSIGQIKKEGGDAQAVMEEVAALKTRMGELEDRDRELGENLKKILSGMPNILGADVPEGADENDNVEVRKLGEPKDFGGQAKEHFEIGEALGMMHFETAAKLSGSRFVLMQGPLARMERALAQLMLDTQTGEHGYTEVSPPLLVNNATVYGTGQLPKFAEDLFQTTRGDWLVPTAEVPLTNIVAEEIVEEESLPRRYTAFTPCFRSEAGSAGKDTRGMIRQHQFYKVEMVSIVSPEDSEAEHERMTGCAETILKKLELPFRTIVLCSGDTGFCARKTYDVEVWLPGQGRYREISSCSNCWDFQARRMNARCRAKGEKNTRFVHTLNGSGLAVGRTLIAVMENYYDPADGGVFVPEVLKPYMGGLDKILPMTHNKQEMKAAS